MLLKWTVVLVVTLVVEAVVENQLTEVMVLHYDDQSWLSSLLTGQNLKLEAEQIQKNSFLLAQTTIHLVSYHVCIYAHMQALYLMGWGSLTSFLFQCAHEPHPFLDKRGFPGNEETTKLRHCYSTVVIMFVSEYNNEYNDY